MLEKGPERIRSEAYLRHVRGQPCLSCGAPGEAHHLQRAQPRAMGRKTGDQWVVPLCHACHMSLHNFGGGETTWWDLRGVDPMEWASASWENFNGH